MRAFLDGTASRQAAAVIALLLTAACAPIPPDVPPFDETFAAIETGVTSREDVVSALGEPTVSRRSGEFVAYAAEQFAAGGVSLGGGIGFIRFHLLALSYDEDGLVETAALEAAKSQRERPLSSADLCIASGECFRLLYSDSSINVQRSPFVVVFATPEEDAAAKDFRPRDGTCTLYHYLEPEDSAWTYAVVLDDRRLGLSTNDGFVRREIAPGRHKLSHLVARIEPVVFDCPAGGSVFVKLYKTGWLDFAFAAVEEGEGRAAVLERRLVLLE